MSEEVTGKKRYTVDCDHDVEVSIVIDHDHEEIKTEWVLDMILSDHFNDDEKRAEQIEKHGGKLNLVIKLAACLAADLGCWDCIYSDNDGFPRLNGGSGILVDSVVRPEFNIESYCEIKIVKDHA
jgi:hypothetical protein